MFKTFSDLTGELRWPSRALTMTDRAMVSLISKFTVSAAGHGSIKTRSAVVTTDQGALVVGPFAAGEMQRVGAQIALACMFDRKLIRRLVHQTVTANSPVPYVFKITQRETHTGPQDRLLRLVLSYQLECDG